jgi:hypothetical protein
LYVQKLSAYFVRNSRQTAPITGDAPVTACLSKFQRTLTFRSWRCIIQVRLTSSNICLFTVSGRLRSDTLSMKVSFLPLSDMEKRSLGIAVLPEVDTRNCKHPSEQRLRIHISCNRRPYLPIPRRALPQSPHDSTEELRAEVSFSLIRIGAWMEVTVCLASRMHKFHFQLGMLLDVL